MGCQFSLGWPRDIIKRCRHLHSPVILHCLHSLLIPWPPLRLPYALSSRRPGYQNINFSISLLCPDIGCKAIVMWLISWCTFPHSPSLHCPLAQQLATWWLPQGPSWLLLCWLGIHTGDSPLVKAVLVGCAKGLLKLYLGLALIRYDVYKLVSAH